MCIAGQLTVHASLITTNRQEASLRSYPWPASKIKSDLMARLHQAHEHERPRRPITVLVAEAIKDRRVRMATDRAMSWCEVFQRTSAIREGKLVSARRGRSSASLL